MLMGSRVAMLGFGRLLIGPRFPDALRHLVSDVDAPVRAAAPMALDRLGSDEATPYLLMGPRQGRAERVPEDAAVRDRRSGVPESHR